VEARLGSVEVRFTERADGDLGGGAPGWCMAKQVHGARAVVVHAAHETPGEADALVTSARGVRLAVRTADCAPVVLSALATVAVVHAGWRGLLAGVVEEAVGAMRALGADGVEAAIGPCIHAECYEFSKDDLDAVAERYGDGVRASTSDGRPALDLPATVRAALDGAGVRLAFDADACTACDATRWFSHRARGESERHATVAWLA
jgi:YfiH family protein